MLYGQRGQGTGRMPGFGDNPNTDEPEDGMFTEEMLDAITRYERSLGGFAQGTGTPPATTTTTTPRSPERCCTWSRASRGTPSCAASWPSWSGSWS